MRLLILVTSVLLMISSSSLAQDREKKQWSPKKEQRKNRPYFLGVDFGVSNSQFRDFATSPLIYDGRVVTFAINATRFDLKKETFSEVRFFVGSYSASIAETFASSSVFTVANQYQQLFRVNKFSNEKWNVKAGGNVAWTLNSRSNPSLGNNSFGFEAIGTLFGSVKVTRDLSRKKEKDVKLLFIKYKLKPLRRDVSLQFNTGLINANLRNGFAFTAQDALINEPNFLEDYQLNFLSGFRLSARMDYSIYLTKGNMIRLSYIWDAYRTGNEFDKFEMGHHMFTASLWFRTK